MRKTVSVNAYAKINLSIDVLGRMDSGYHQIETVLQQIELYDIITVESLEKAGIYTGFNITLDTDNNKLPEDDKNLAYQAAVIMAETFCPSVDNKILIKLAKKIPVAAGLAGGSSDAAAVILALSKLWELNVSLKDLCKIGVKVGADVPFCILGNAKNNPNLDYSDDENASSTALAEGIGDKLTVLPSLKGWVILVRPDITVPTGDIYRKLTEYGVLSGHNENSGIVRPDKREMIKGLEDQCIDMVMKNMINVLETVCTKEYPVVVYTKNIIEESGKPQKVLMSGSGPTVFGYYDNEERAREGFSHIRDIFLRESEYRYDLYLVELL